MRQQQGKFILFSLDEFAPWLRDLQVQRAIKLVQNHHTYTPSYKDFDGQNHFAMLQAMEAFHISDRKFSEIAQSFTTFRDGTLAVCRPLESDPAGIKGANIGAICIEHLGNFDKDKDLMTQAHRDCIIKMNAVLCHKFGLKPNSQTVVYHHWWDLNTGNRTDGGGTTKSCPGSGFFGGNKVADAVNNFIPLVNQELARIQPSGGAAAGLAGQPLFKAWVTATVLNVRTQPAASAPVIDKVNQGEQVEVFEENGDWRRIHASEPRWVSGEYLEKIIKVGT